MLTKTEVKTLYRMLDQLSDQELQQKLITMEMIKSRLDDPDVLKTHQWILLKLIEEIDARNEVKSFGERLKLPHDPE